MCRHLFRPGAPPRNARTDHTVIAIVTLTLVLSLALRRLRHKRSPKSTDIAPSAFHAEAIISRQARECSAPQLRDLPVSPRGERRSPRDRCRLPRALRERLTARLPTRNLGGAVSWGGPLPRRHACHARAPARSEFEFGGRGCQRSCGSRCQPRSGPGIEHSRRPSLPAWDCPGKAPQKARKEENRQPEIGGCPRCKRALPCCRTPVDAPQVHAPPCDKPPRGAAAFGVHVLAQTREESLRGGLERQCRGWRFRWVPGCHGAMTHAPCLSASRLPRSVSRLLTSVPFSFTFTRFCASVSPPLDFDQCSAKVALTQGALGLCWSFVPRPEALEHFRLSIFMTCKRLRPAAPPQVEC